MLESLALLSFFTNEQSIHSTSPCTEELKSLDPSIPSLCPDVAQSSGFSIRKLKLEIILEPRIVFPQSKRSDPSAGFHPDPIELSNSAPKILYCRCAFAQVVPDAVKDQVLEQLLESGASFESVSDLCEMSARKDPRLGELLAGDAPVRIAACFPRAVKWMFHHAGYPFPDDGRVEVLNMREMTAEEVVNGLVTPASPEKETE